MALTPMRYKHYVWPHNPRVYSIDYERKMAAHKLPFGRYLLQDLGQTNRIMAGEGEFVGEDAYEQFGKLANAFYDAGPGLLIHPLWQTAQAHFVSLRLEQEPRADYVRYSFVFWEDSGQSTEMKKVALTTENGQNGSEQGDVQPAGNQTAAPMRHRVVQGDTLWAIARKYGVTLEEILAWNPGIKNPNLIYVGDEVRVG